MYKVATFPLGATAPQWALASSFTTFVFYRPHTTTLHSR